VIIGSTDGTSNFFTGSIDDARIYNRSLTSSDVSRLYEWGPSPGE
jgi:hypothetical protein